MSQTKRRADLDLVAQMRPKFAVAARAAGKAIGAGKFGRWSVAPETYVNVWSRGNTMHVDLVVDNFLLEKVKRGCKVPRLEEGDRHALRRWVEDGPTLLVSTARRAVSMLITAGAKPQAAILMSATCGRLRIER